MKALTIHQPWASLIVEGFKPREFRSWPAPPAFVGQRIVLHAAKRPIRTVELRDILAYVTSADGARDGIAPAAHDLLEKVWRREVELPTSAGLGTATLGTPRRVERLHDNDEVVYAWPMIDVEKWPTPVPANGARKFWEWRA